VACSKEDRFQQRATAIFVHRRSMALPAGDHGHSREGDEQDKHRQRTKRQPLTRWMFTATLMSTEVNAAHGHVAIPQGP
jgi:hypothetical protein